MTLRWRAVVCLVQNYFHCQRCLRIGNCIPLNFYLYDLFSNFLTEDRQKSLNFFEGRGRRGGGKVFGRIVGQMGETIALAKTDFYVEKLKNLRKQLLSNN